MPYDPSLISILFADYGKLYLFISTGKIIPLNMPQNIISNLDLINSAQLDSLINAFCEYHKISSSRIYFLLSENICFEKLFLKSDKLLEGKMNDFLCKVPFENVLSRKYESDKNIALIAVNGDAIMGLKKAFESIHFTVESIIPFSMFKGKIKSFDINSARQLIAETGTLKQLNIVRKENTAPANPKTTGDENRSKKTPDKKNENKTLLFSIPVFIILIIILIYIYMKSAGPPKKTGYYTGSIDKIERMWFA